MITSINCKEKADCKSKLDWTEEIITKFKDVNNFNLRYSLVDLDYQAPPQSFQIIDGRIKGSGVGFVIDMGKGQHSESDSFNDMFSDDPVLVAQLQSYYDRYWNKCTKLKDGAKIYEEELEELRKKYYGK